MTHPTWRLLQLLLACVLLLPAAAGAQQIADEAWLDAMEWRLIGPWRGGDYLWRWDTDWF